jgi:hypothetical protein
MKTKLYLGIAFRLILLFGTGMLFSTFTPYLHEFFGDVKRIKIDHFSIDGAWDWSSTHYWYFSLIICLFILSIVNCVVSIIKLISKYEPEFIENI